MRNFPRATRDPESERQPEPLSSIRTTNFEPQIAPLRIGLLDELQLPCAPPPLDAFLARDRSFYVAMLLEVHEVLHAIALGEAGDQSLAMLDHPSVKIIGDADVQCPVTIGSENVHPIDMFAQHVVALGPGSRFRSPGMTTVVEVNPMKNNRVGPGTLRAPAPRR